MQVTLTSSNSERNKVKDLVDDVKAEFQARFKIDREFDCKPKLGRLCLQRDESTEAICDMKVRLLHDFNYTEPHSRAIKLLLVLTSWHNHVLFALFS